MFSKTITRNREAIYAVLASSPVPPHAITPSIGSAFMVAPGLLVTAAHAIDDALAPGVDPEGTLSVIRAPDIGRKPEPVALAARDDRTDLALLRLDDPRSTACLRLLDGPVPVGTRCGSSGFPRILVDTPPPARGISLIELFQGAEICAFVDATGLDGAPAARYETDSPMYGDAAGCPGFLPSGEVFGMYSRFVPSPAERSGPSDAEQRTRAGVSLWVPSMEILAFARAHGAPLP